VLANKQDLPQAANPSELTDALDLFKLRDRAWYVQGSCATTGEGIVEGLTWLADAIKAKKKTTSF
jgi:ADP-ribosylation factor protein 1